MAKTTFLQIPVAVNSGIASTYSERDDKTCRWDPRTILTGGFQHWQTELVIC